MLAPRARVDVVRDTYFETTVEDPYRWMEDWEGDEARAWVRAQGAHARSVLEELPHRQPLLERIAELRGGVPRLEMPRMVGERTFCLRQDPGADLAALVVRDAPGAGERVLLDPAAMAGEGGAREGGGHSTIDWYVPSPDGRHVACGISEDGSEASVLHVLEVETGAMLDDRISGMRFAFVSWLEDGRSFVYHRYRDAPAGSSPERRRDDSRSCVHHLGDDPERDAVVLARDANPRVPLTPRDRPFVVVPPSGGWMLAIVSHSALANRTNEHLSDCTLYVAPRGALADPASCPWSLVAGVHDGVRAFALRDDVLYLVHRRDAPRYQVSMLRLPDDDLASARVVVPASQRVVEAVEVAGDQLLVRDLDAGIGRVRRIPLAGGEPSGDAEEIPLPVDGSILEWSAHPQRPELLLQLASWTSAPRVYRCDAATGAVTDTGWVPPSPVDFSGVEARELQVPARDGTLIPMSVIHRKGLPLDCANPTLLTGYGSYGITLDPSFVPEMLAWYERGGVYAVAHVRGGGEHGSQWHEAGRKLRKETTIIDFIDCAEYLVAQGWTRPDLLAGSGGSAGGIPTGGALVRRPDLWAVMIMHVPLTNALRAELSENGPINVPEFGSVTTRDGLRALLIVDSYLRVRDGVDYPAVLLTTGMNDPRVPSWQPAKMTARLQAASSSGRPVLLRVEEHGGHGFGSTQRQRDEELADELAFLLQQFGL